MKAKALYNDNNVYYLFYDGLTDETTEWLTHTEHDIIYERFESVGVTQFMETSNLNFAVLPNLTASGSTYEWYDGTNNKSWREYKSNSIKNIISMDENNNISIKTVPIMAPNNVNKILESEVDYLTCNGKQVYFLSLEDPTIGCTFISPKESNPSISDYELDMYKCRCLKLNESEEKSLLDITVNNGESNIQVDISYISTSNYKYGYSIKEDITKDEVKVYNKYKDNDFEDVIVRINRSYEEAQSEASILPEKTVAVIKP